MRETIKKVVCDICLHNMIYERDEELIKLGWLTYPDVCNYCVVARQRGGKTENQIREVANRRRIERNEIRRNRRDGERK